jgi:hypothetical protein
MRQKYILLRDDDKQELVLREMGEIDREIYALLCEETYSYETIERAIKKGQQTLTRTLRTDNIFPQGVYAVKIGEAVQEMFAERENGSRELFLNDVDFLKIEKNAVEEEIIVIEEDDPADIDDLLDEDVEVVEDDDLPENLTKGGIGVDSPLKIADDEVEDMDMEAG